MNKKIIIPRPEEFDVVILGDGDFSFINQFVEQIN